MSSPCFGTISTDVTGLWTSPGKCKTPSPDQELLKSPPSKRKSSLLDPFLLAVNVEDTRHRYGPELSAPKLNHTHVLSREIDPDDYPLGEESWMAAFFRQWALDHEEEHGAMEEGWGVWSLKAGEDASWEWPCKRIQAHKTGSDGQIECLVNWVGQRHLAPRVKKEQLVAEARDVYDKVHGLVHIQKDAILQTCKQVAEEASPILHRRRIEILGPPVLTIRINPNRYDGALYFIKHLLKLIGECRAAEIEETGASANVILPWLFSGDKDRNIRIGTLFSVELSQSSPITNGRKFQDFFQRTMRHMRRQSTVVVRLLVDGLFRTHPFNIMEFWSETAVDLEQYSRMINFRFVFVVPKQQLESYKGLAVRPRSVPPWITEDMWSVEAAKRGGVDPAVD
ncbi:unnamed protein product [Alternaria alternata]